MTVVLDNSVVVEWLTGGEYVDRAEDLIATRFSEFWAPALFWSELVYVLGKRVRRDLMSRGFRDVCLGQVNSLGIRTDMASALPGVTFDRVLSLCDEHTLTVYDAVYLELALRLGGALATFEMALASAAQTAGVEVLGLA